MRHFDFFNHSAKEEQEYNNNSYSLCQMIKCRSTSNQGQLKAIHIFQTKTCQFEKNFRTAKNVHCFCTQFHFSDCSDYPLNINKHMLNESMFQRYKLVFTDGSLTTSWDILKIENSDD